jgi:hypothetical protein
MEILAQFLALPKSSLVWANQSCRSDGDFDPQFGKERK